MKPDILFTSTSQHIENEEGNEESIIMNYSENVKCAKNMQEERERKIE